ncbi:ATP-binding protein [Desulfuromonas versatilis]|uniref:ATP-binding protein n=1 Tax=Desulfuromonas versatilis TaxID=2802975 RepID=A0ABM8HY53_9BACT|nr:DUF87 domain-containing protein [Desulfuromonas versatilis]BCR06039.1 ATP-binding protein [Desulfuromonas versatilis]
MDDYEKLGAFYLGKTFDLQQERLTDELVLYDSRDLTTHAVIIGMTGSGKTGLGIGLLEEAAIDHIPVIAIDPKGDLGNLLLSFPELKPEDFKPWVDPREAAEKGVDVAEYARRQAELWRKGLADWGQGPERIRKLRDSAELVIYTPGSSAGLPVSVLRSFNAPPPAIQDDPDLLRERIQSTATGILALMGVSADPITSREHILIANLLEHFWRAGLSLDVAGLIGAIQDPPLQQIGVMGLDAFYPAKERFALAMKLNNLLASPGFGAWMEGAPLSAADLLYTATGKPRVSILSIAHLAESERMFFVCMLLNEVLGWMRSQPGTGSLRAILYMDEIFGYLPPSANPPSKKLFLTLLKQARAFGLGLVLATQNPVDLDYKALSNTGTWFIGRLQTERDKARLMEGLEGAAGAGSFDRQRMEQILAGLGKRRFLLHNVHEDQPVVFGTRWALSYLPGPLTRDQIRTLMAGRQPEAAAAEAAPTPPPARPVETGPPLLPAGVTQYYLPLRRGAGAGAEVVYHPRVVGAADVHYLSSRPPLDATRRYLLACEPSDSPLPVEWQYAEQLELDPADLAGEPASGASFAPCPAPVHEAKNFKEWERLFTRWIRSGCELVLWQSPGFKTVSAVGESERDFRIRVQQQANEQRDEAVAKLREKYAERTAALEERLRKAEQALSREQDQARRSKLDTAISFGTALLGAFLGRKRGGAGTASRVGTAMRGAGRIGKEAADVERAEENVEALQHQLEELAAEFEREVATLNSGFDAQAEQLTEFRLRPKTADIHVHFVGLAWAPYLRGPDGRLNPAWL